MLTTANAKNAEEFIAARMYETIIDVGDKLNQQNQQRQIPASQLESPPPTQLDGPALTSQAEGHV